MAIYSVNGWVWAGLGSPTTLLPVTFTDDDATLSAYYTSDNETLEIDGTTYSDPQGGTYELSFTDSVGDTYTEDFLLFNTGSTYIFVPLPNSSFDDGSTVDTLGGWQDWTSGFLWDDVVCFTRGTHILTPEGMRNIETLNIGELVVTKSSGAQPIAWIGSNQTDLSRLSPENADRLRPIRICKGALGAGLPRRDLVVSQQHRILVSSKICERMFEKAEVLVAAKRLVGLPGIAIDTNCDGVDYFHILFQQHEIVFSEGAPTESLFTGPEALRSVSEQARLEIFAIFPELRNQKIPPVSAAFIPENKQQRNLVERHKKNARALHPSRY